jgi:hypothetical protein
MLKTGKIKLNCWRETSARFGVAHPANHTERGPSSLPIKNPSTIRRHEITNGHDFQQLLIGPKGLGSRVRLDGGGAADLTMHFFGIGFRKAPALLRQQGCSTLRID